jgi:putative ABC transport system ATP-binding protein
MTQAALQIKNLRHAYGEKTALTLPGFELGQDEHAVVIGPSGCGKSSLLHIVAGLLTPAEGDVRVCGQDLRELSAAERDRLRGDRLGIVLQQLHLLPALTVLENLLLAQKFARTRPDRDHACALLTQLGVGDKAQAHPSALSQGEAQRVAIARAVVHRPRLVLADEPTSSLDDANARRVIDLLVSQARSCGAALLVVTHDARIRGSFARELQLGAAA